MTLQEFSALVKGMKAVYTDPKFIPDDYAMTVWYALLKDMTYAQATMAVQRYMSAESRTPTVADIRRMAAENSTPVDDSISELEAWSIVYKAICNLQWDAPEKEFDKLPDLCKKAIGTAANLREMAQMDTNTVESVEQSHFIRAYRTAKQQRQNYSVLSIGLKQQIDAMRISTGDGPARIEKHDYKHDTDGSIQDHQRVYG